MIEAGRSYRLRREFEVRDEKTGTLKSRILAGTVLTVKRIDTDEDHAWVEGVAHPLPLNALRRAVDVVAS
jgi:hypothetical protein